VFHKPPREFPYNTARKRGRSKDLKKDLIGHLEKEKILQQNKDPAAARTLGKRDK